MPASTSDLFTKVGNPGTATTLSAPGYTIGGGSINVGATTNFPTDTAVVFSIDTVTIVNGVEVRNANSYGVFLGIVTNGTTISSLSLLYGTPQNYAAGATTRVYITDSAVYMNRLITGLLAEHKTTGAHAAITATSVTSAGAITAPSFVLSGGGGADGYNVGLPAPNTVTYNGNRSYDIVFNGTNQTGILSNGMRLRTTRTVAAPTQCTSLNGTNQYYSKTSPAGMTFTDDFVVSAWVKLSSYASGDVISRYNGTSGWDLLIDSSGRVNMQGFNASSANYSIVQSYQSLPLNKWVHVSAQLDMSSFSATTTTSYIMIDGIDVPAAVLRGGTNPTALVQAGNLEIGSRNGGSNPFPGKIAQAAIFSAKVTQATIRSYISQSLGGTETNLISAYSFNNSVNDLNTTNANNLTPNGSALATNADSPFTQDDTGTPAGSNDYAIVTKKAFSTNTTISVQVPEGCAIPTSGGVSSVVYSSNAVPFGFPKQKGKWSIVTVLRASSNTGSPTQNTWYNVPGLTTNLPIGVWDTYYEITPLVQRSGSGVGQVVFTLGQTSAAASENPEFDSISEINASSPTNATIIQTIRKSGDISVSAATPYYVNYRTTFASMLGVGIYNDDGGSTSVKFRNAYL